MRVAIVRSKYLPISETFIYLELVNLKTVVPIVCTRQLMNLEQFPFSDIYLFRELNELNKILKREQVDLIHARFGFMGVELLDLKRQLDLPMLTSFHGYDLPSNRRSLARYRGRLKRLFAEGEAFTVASNHMKQILVRFGCPEDKIFVHYSGIDIECFPFKRRTMPEDGRITILSIGRLVEKKGMEDLVDGFYKAQKQIPSIRLRIAGDGPLRNKLRKQIKRLNLQDKVDLLGAIPHAEVAKEMQQAHLFALASKTARSGNQEGIPNVLKEAMACGLPVVSTWHAGIPELVTHKQSGYLVPEGDSNALAQSLMDLLQNPQQWEKMGRHGRKVVEHSFNLGKQVPELEDFYRVLLAGKTENTSGDGKEADF